MSFSENHYDIIMSYSQEENRRNDVTEKKSGVSGCEIQENRPNYGRGDGSGTSRRLLYRGREYRLATYRGARVERWSAGGASIRQGKYRLSVELLEGKGCPLRAPTGGTMGRTVHESLRSTVRYRFWAGETLLLDHTDRCAGFEYAET